MKIKKNKIHPVLYFFVAALLIAYFFPREGKFKYQFFEGKPWRYGLLTAPVDFPIYKTDLEIQAEKDSTLKRFEPYYRLNPDIEVEETDKLRDNYRSVLKEIAIPVYIHSIQNSLQHLYQNGVISAHAL